MSEPTPELPNRPEPPIQHEHQMEFVENIKHPPGAGGASDNLFKCSVENCGYVEYRYVHP